MPSDRALAFGPHQLFMLDIFGDLALAAWRAPAYLVGSSVGGATYRDVDVRVMLPDEDYERCFGDTPANRHRDPRWRAQMLAWVKLGESLTDLPIDFQVEPRGESDLLFPRSQNRRVTLGRGYREDGLRPGLFWKAYHVLEATDD